VTPYLFKEGKTVSSSRSSSFSAFFEHENEYDDEDDF